MNIVRAAIFTGILVLSCVGATAEKAGAVRDSTAPRLASLSELTDGLVSAHRGHVLVVNFWATWCAPCVAELPELIRFHHEYRGKGVDVVGVSLDFLDLKQPDKVPAALTKFLEKKPLPYPVRVKNTTDNEALINFYQKEWTGAIPSTFIYDKTGKQVFARAGNTVDFGMLKREVDPLLP